MASEWYVSLNGTSKGPMTSKELRALAKDGKIQPTDLVWKEGMKQWTPASQIKGLFAGDSAGSYVGTGKTDPVLLPKRPKVKPTPLKPSAHDDAPPELNSIPVPQAAPLEPATDFSGLNDTSSLSSSSDDETFGDELIPRRRRTAPAKSGTPIRVLLASVVIVGLSAGGCLVVSFMGRNLPSDLGGNGGTHIVTEDVCLYEYSLGDLHRQELLFHDLTNQQWHGPLSGSKGGPVAIEDKKASILKSKTTLEILKTEVFATDILVHFIRVRSGPHAGKEGWITDRYIRANR